MGPFGGETARVLGSTFPFRESGQIAAFSSEQAKAPRHLIDEAGRAKATVIATTFKNVDPEYALGEIIAKM